MSFLSRRLAANARRRELLSLRADAQRAALAGAFHQLRTPLRVADRVLGVTTIVRAHPMLFAAGVAAVLTLIRGRLLRTVGRAFAALRLWRTVGRLAGWRAGSG